MTTAATDRVIEKMVVISGSGPLALAAAEVFAAVTRRGFPATPVVAVDIPGGSDD